MPRLEGRVEFRDVVFGYEKHKPVINNVSFTVDRAGPSLNILTPSSLQILNRSVANVTWSGNDLTTWVIGYRYSLDNGAWSPLDA